MAQLQKNPRSIRPLKGERRDKQKYCRMFGVAQHTVCRAIKTFSETDKNKILGSLKDSLQRKCDGLEVPWSIGLMMIFLAESMHALWPKGNILNKLVVHIDKFTGFRFPDLDSLCK